MKSRKEAIDALQKRYSEQELAHFHWQTEYLAKVADHIAFKAVVKILHEAAFGEEN